MTVRAPPDERHPSLRGTECLSHQRSCPVFADTHTPALLFWRSFAGLATPDQSLHMVVWPSSTRSGRGYLSLANSETNWRPSFIPRSTQFTVPTFEMVRPGPCSRQHMLVLMLISRSPLLFAGSECSGGCPDHHDPQSQKTDAVFVCLGQYVSLQLSIHRATAVGAIYLLRALQEAQSPALPQGQAGQRHE